MAWSLVESTIEVAIGKQLGVAPLETSIITAGLQFRSRAAVLLSLLNREPSENATAIRIVKDMQSITDRNDILHSVIGGHRQTIWFNRRKTDARFTSKIEPYDFKRLTRAALSCADLATKLQSELDITNEDYSSFFQTAHNAANN